MNPERELRITRSINTSRKLYASESVISFSQRRWIIHCRFESICQLMGWHSFLVWLILILNFTARQYHSRTELNWLKCICDTLNQRRNYKRIDEKSVHKQNWKSPFCIDGFPYRRKKEKERGYCAFLRLFVLPPARPVSSRIAFIAPATSPLRRIHRLHQQELYTV